MDNSGDKQLADETLTNQLLLEQLAGWQRDFAATIVDVDPATRVPWCGDWTVADLVEHLTYIHHWAAALARSEHYPDQRDVGAHRTGAELRTRYEAAASDLRTTLSELDPDAPARTLVDGGTVAFWYRRQAHETLVHLWDLKTATGRPLTVDPPLWADTVDEAVTVLHPRQLRLGRAAAARVRLVLVATDVVRSWTLPASDGDPDGPATTVTGPAQALALLLWGRSTLADAGVEVDGDPAALRTVLADHFLP